MRTYQSPSAAAMPPIKPPRRAPRPELTEFERRPSRYDTAPSKLSTPVEIIFRHRGIGPEIVSPKHGDCGWTPEGELKIFVAAEFRVVDERGDRRVGTNQGGWHSLEDYRALKVRLTGKADWRAAEVRSAGWSSGFSASVATRSDYYSGHSTPLERRSAFGAW